MIKAINFTAGIVTGALIGMAVGALLDPICDKQKKIMQKKSNHLFRAIGNAMDSFTEMF